MDVDPKLAAFIRNILIGSPVARSLGVEVEVLQVDRVILRMSFAPGHVTHGRVLHGGVIATLIDIAGAAASGSGASPEVKGGATSSLAISYLAPADGVDLVAEARIVQRGKSQTVADVEVRDAGGRAIAKALLTSRLF